MQYLIIISILILFVALVFALIPLIGISWMSFLDDVRKWRK